MELDGEAAAGALPALEINDVIVGESYYVFPGTATTACCLKLSNGFAVVGVSTLDARPYFDPELGRMIARDNARDQVWSLEHYAQISRRAGW